MNTSQYANLSAAIEDDRFVDVDLALRRGRHIDRQDDDWYAYLLDAQSVLEDFYRRYGCELVHRSDGYFFLLPTSDKLPRRQLSTPDMLVGQAVALLYLEPASVESGGVVTRETVLAHLATVLGSDALLRAFNPKKRRIDERVAQQTVRTKVGEALRRLAALGFVETLEGDHLRLRPALMRFAEPVRTAESPAAALAKLLASGEVVIEAEDTADADVDVDAADAARHEVGDTEQEDDEGVADDWGAEQAGPLEEDDDPLLVSEKDDGDRDVETDANAGHEEGTPPEGGSDDPERE